MATNVCYTSWGGSAVNIRPHLNPYDILHVSPSCTHAEAKVAFRRKISSPVRQKRALAALAYDMLTKKLANKYAGRYKILDAERNKMTFVAQDHIFLALIGDCKSLINMCRSQPSLLDKKDEFHCSVLYISARCGWTDMTIMLLKIMKGGEQLNSKMGLKSTALHAASYYGQKPVILPLLEHGVSGSLKNKAGHTPKDEAKSADIVRLFHSIHTDGIAKIASKLIKEELASNVTVHKAKKGGEKIVIAKEIHRSQPGYMNDATWASVTSKWELCWHGTRFNRIRSIFRHGLKGAGSTLPTGEVIDPRPGHIPLGRPMGGSTDWAKAVFVSPSILYASHIVYSEVLMSGGERWHVVLTVRVKAHSYTSHPSTLAGSYTPMAGEPTNSEHRVDDEIEHLHGANNQILQITKAGFHEVQSILFLKLSFLEDLSSYNIHHYSDLIKVLSNV